MRINYKDFCTRYAVRKDSELAVPRQFDSVSVDYPYNTILIYLATQATELGPSNSEPFLAMEPPRCFIEHVKEYHLANGATPYGAPRYRPDTIATQLDRYRRTHRKYVALRRDDTIRSNRNNLLVVNFAPLSHVYRYTESYLKPFHVFRNTTGTLVDRLNVLAERFEGYHIFMDLQLPDVIPERDKLVATSSVEVLTKEQLNYFDTPEALMAREWWLFLSDKPEFSILNNLTQKAIDSIVLTANYGSKSVFIDLGMLLKWKKTKNDKGEVVGNLSADQLQRRLFSLFLRLRFNDSEEFATTDNKTVKAKTTSKLPSGEPPSIIGKKETAPEPTDSDLDSLWAYFDDAGLNQKVMETETPTLSDLSFLVDAKSVVVDAASDDSEEQQIQAFVNDPNKTEIIKEAQKLRENGRITQAAFKGILRDLKAADNIPDPWGSNETLSELAKITPEALKVPNTQIANDRATIPDKSVLHASTTVIPKEYLKTIIQRDMASVIHSVQKNGMIVKDWKVEPKKDCMSSYETHKVTMRPLVGKPFTVTFHIPKPDPSGTMRINNVKTKLRPQRTDEPIRKVAPHRVALTAYLRKLFIEKSSRVKHDYNKYISKQLIAKRDDPEDKSISKLTIRSTFTRKVVLPFDYTVLARSFSNVTARYEGRTYNLTFDWPRTEANIEKHTITVGDEKAYYIGTQGETPLYMLESGDVITDKGNVPILTLLDVDLSKAPLTLCEMKISDQMLPLGIIQGYFFGLKRLTHLFDQPVERHPSNVRVPLRNDQAKIVFDDEVLVYSRTDRKAVMYLSGFAEYADVVKRYPIDSFNTPDVYFMLLEERGLSSRYLPELDDLRKTFIDPITEGLLKDDGYPTTFPELLDEAVKLLKTEWAPDETDIYMRYRGYERIPGALYKEMHLAIKKRNRVDIEGDTRIDFNPFSVWQNILQDPATIAVREANPIQNTREQEGFTFRGEGGRSDQSMVARTRKYNDGDLGTVSESAPDSGAVGIIGYLAPDANFVDLRGRTRPYDAKKDGNAKLFSTSTLMAPCADQDDAKRINFISIQADQGVYSYGNELPPLRTGEENVIASRVDKLFASTAQDDGVVSKVTPFGLTVTYTNGKSETYPLGLHYGEAAGVVHPQSILPYGEEGRKVKKGEVLTYNEFYFEPDRFNPGYVSMKSSMVVTTAILDNINMLEDGSMISERTAQRLQTGIAYKRMVTCDFDQHIQNLVSLDSHVDLDTVLCTITDPETQYEGDLDEASLNLLRNMGGKAPKANHVGHVTRIEAYYRGKFENLSDNLKEVVRKIEARNKKITTGGGEEFFSGEVDSSFRMSGKTLEENSLCLIFYVTHDMGVQRGDKGVFAHQLKTIFSGIMQGVNETEMGKILDALFGGTSILDRMVNSPITMGATNRLLDVFAERVVSIFDGESKPTFAKG